MVKNKMIGAIVARANISHMHFLKFEMLLVLFDLGS